MAGRDTIQTNTAFRKFRFLGQRWRFLKSDIQQERFPGFKRAHVENITLGTVNVETQTSSTPRDILKNEKAVSYSENTPTPPKGEEPSVVAEEPDESGEQNRCRIQLRNAQLFQRNGLFPAEFPQIETATVASPRAPPPNSQARSKRLHTGATDATRTPETVVPSRPPSDAPSTKKRNNKIRNRTVIDTPGAIGADKSGFRRIKLELNKFEIGQSFKAYSMENGYRIPSCLIEDGKRPISPSKGRGSVLAMQVLRVEPPEQSLFPSSGKLHGDA